MAWVKKDHNDHWVSTPLPCTGLPTSRPGCPEPHPAWPWMPPGMGHPQSPRATCSSASPHWVKTFLLISNLNLLSHFKTIPPCPVIKKHAAGIWLTGHFTNASCRKVVTNGRSYKAEGGGEFHSRYLTKKKNMTDPAGTATKPLTSFGKWRHVIFSSELNS